jgi:hypothetical protein
LLIALGTIKSQGQLDGKFRAAGLLSRWNVFYFRWLRSPAIATNGSFRRDPEPQAPGDQRNRADAAKPQHDKPQEALRQRTRWRLAWHQ